MATYSITFRVDDDADIYGDQYTLEHEILDLIKVAVIPALNLELLPLSFEVKKSRKR